MPANLRRAVSKAHRYEPDINPSYRDLTGHYEVEVVPARARKSRDKTKAEVGVQVMEHWILTDLRNRQFFSLDDLNTSIGVRGAAQPATVQEAAGLSGIFLLALDRQALRAPPEQPNVNAERKKARGHIDYHVEFVGHY